MWRNTAAKQKPRGEILQQSTVLFFKKTMKLNSQAAQYEKDKINKDHFRKKKEKNHNKKKKTMQRYIITIYNVLKKKTTWLNSQPV